MMAIRVQNINGKILQSDSPMPHFVSSPWWNFHEQQLSQTLSKNLSLRVKSPSQCCEEVKCLGLQLEDQSSPSTQSSTQSQLEVTAMEKATSQDHCISSDSVQKESYGKHAGEQVQSAFLEFSPHPSQVELSQSAVQVPYVYSDPYFSGLYSAYGPQAMIQPQMMGMAPARVPLPPDLAQDGPMYVNAKQYHAILRRRQMRAKLEAQNKLVKGRKPYLHESRHQHALNRVRGSAGRFLSKKQQESESTPSAGSLSASLLSHEERNMQDMEAEKSKIKRHNASITTSSAALGYTHSDVIFQQQNNRFMSVSSQMPVSVPGLGGLVHNGTPHRDPAIR
ncbi:hypothetical protein ACH5RR_006189 [Cinchona calisaya]|uniref:Nuclear transcription factor Y subunit n=1 Tax=Cinchona calisaya TaxID=153742 RepID=A0ABD3ANM6_9GENT